MEFANRSSTLIPWCVPALRSISFGFTTQSGRSVGVQFECALIDGGTDSPSNFTACDSPVKYANLRDGEYRFYVRAQGETIADSRKFIKVGNMWWSESPWLFYMEMREA